MLDKMELHWAEHDVRWRHKPQIYLRHNTTYNLHNCDTDKNGQSMINLKWCKNTTSTDMQVEEYPCQKSDTKRVARWKEMH